MEENKFKVGQFVWADLTTNQAGTLKDFYKELIGWQEFPVNMKDDDGEYQDYAMLIDQENAAGGICNARGLNKGLPPQWIMYIYVEEVEERLNKSLELGAELIHSHKKADGSYNYVILKDPAGAIFGLGNMQ